VAVQGAAACSLSRNAAASRGLLRHSDTVLLMRPVVLKQGEGERVAMGPASVLIKATGEETAGTFYLGEAEIPPGFPGPPPHVHDKLHDMFLVIEGTLTINTPAGWEGYMRELAMAASEGRTLTSEEIGRIASKYDFRPV
jgi:hypothetical protein